MVLVARDLTTPKAKVVSMELHEVLAYISSHSTGYEVIDILASSTIKPFFDIDYVGIQGLHDNIQTQCCHQICKWFNVSNEALAVSKTVYPIKPEKLSLHIVVTSVFIDYGEFINWSKQHDILSTMRSLFIDPKVYSVYRKFRLLYCSKRDTLATKLPITFDQAGQEHYHLVTSLPSQFSSYKFDKAVSFPFIHKAIQKTRKARNVRRQKC